jgi:membrane protease YdiL (CAAX protease family)
VTTPRQRDDLPSLEPLSSGALVRKSTLIYGVMSALGLAVVAFGHKNLPALVTAAGPAAFGHLALVGLLGAGILLVLSYFFEDWFASFRELKTQLVRLLGPISVPVALYLAVLTAFGEELFFRGALQPFAGLVLTSVLFGLLHMGQNAKISAWSVWALIAGFLLGWMRDETGSLWPPIVAHFGVNAVSLLTLRRNYRAYLGHLKEDR